MIREVEQAKLDKNVLDMYEVSFCGSLFVQLDLF